MSPVSSADWGMQARDIQISIDVGVWLVCYCFGPTKSATLNTCILKPASNAKEIMLCLQLSKGQG